MNFLRKAYDGYHRFEQTLREGHYNANAHPFWQTLTLPKSDLPETPKIKVSSNMVGTSRTVGKRFVWASIFALGSIKVLAASAFVVSTFGVGFLALEYRRCKRRRMDDIVEINTAGQRVHGTRADLCRLDQAQRAVIRVRNGEKRASDETVEESVAAIIGSVSGEVSRVKVIGADMRIDDAAVYRFKEPLLSYVDDGAAAQTLAPLPQVAANADMPALAPAWDKTAQRDVIRQIKVLHDMMPPEMREELVQQITKKPAPQPAPARRRR